MKAKGREVVWLRDHTAANGAEQAQDQTGPYPDRSTSLPYDETAEMQQKRKTLGRCDMGQPATALKLQHRASKA